MKGLSEMDLAKRCLARQIVIEAARLNMDSKIMLMSLIKEIERLPSQTLKRQKVLKARLELVGSCIACVITAPFILYLLLIAVVFFFGSFPTISLLSYFTNKTQAEELMIHMSICIPVKLLEFPFIQFLGAPSNFLRSEYVCKLMQIKSE
jgi:hypothetical protein